MIIFVVGTGRSGTNMVGRLLDSHPAVHVTIEQPPMFDLVTQISVYGKRARIVELVAAYRERAAKHSIYADKSHHALWCAEELQGAFGDAARFIAVERDPRAVVASMLRHGGVMRWVHRWRDLPVPCPFAGLENASDYGPLSVEQKCAARWRSHQRRIAVLRGRLDHLLVLNYERLVVEPAAELARVADFLGIENRFNAELPHRDSLERWREQLTGDQVAAIEQFVEAA
jgi:hypothetical protein